MKARQHQGRTRKPAPYERIVDPSIWKDANALVKP